MKMKFLELSHPGVNINPNQRKLQLVKYSEIMLNVLIIYKMYKEHFISNYLIQRKSSVEFRGTAELA